MTVTAFKEAVRNKYLSVDPFAGWKNERLTERQVRVATEEEIDALQRAADDMRGPQGPVFVVTAIATGGRRGELYGLRWEDIDFDEGQLTFLRTKNGKPRVIPLSPDVLRLLTKLRMNEGFKDDPFHSMRNHYHFWGRVRKAAGCEGLRLHDLRKTALTRWLLAGVPLPVVQKLAGHADIQTTIRYYSAVCHDDLKEALAKTPPVKIVKAKTTT